MQYPIAKFSKQTNFAADNLIVAKNLFPLLYTFKSHRVSVQSKQIICFVPIIRNWIIQSIIHILRFAQTFPSYMPIFATFSALIFKEKCMTLFFWVTRCCPQWLCSDRFLDDSLPLLWLWEWLLFFFDWDAFFSSTDLLLISMNLPHKPRSVSGGFIILCYINHSTELHNVTILVMMTISVCL